MPPRGAEDRVPTAVGTSAVICRMISELAAATGPGSRLFSLLSSEADRLSAAIALTPAAVTFSSYNCPARSSCLHTGAPGFALISFGETSVKEFCRNLLRRAALKIGMSDKASVFALRGGAQHNELRIAKLDGHDQPFVSL
jgi:hypothetical protein